VVLKRNVVKAEVSALQIRKKRRIPVTSRQIHRGLQRFGMTCGDDGFF
jgi:hypothetical protein